MRKRLTGVFPVVPTVFDERGALDLEGQRRCVDFMIDAGSDGLCILANFSEQFVLSDEERDVLTRRCSSTSADACPSSSRRRISARAICAERSRHAQELGAAMVMIMPPYHGATIRVREPAIFDFFRRVVGRDRHPDHDPGRAGQPGRRSRRRFWPAWRGRSRTCRYFKIEMPQAAAQAARADRARRRRDRGAMGRRGRRSR